MEPTGEMTRAPAMFGDAPESDVHALQNHLSHLLSPILEELTDARKCPLASVHNKHIF